MMTHLQRLAFSLSALSLVGACQTAAPEEQAIVEPEGRREFHNELSIAVGEFNEAAEKGTRIGLDYERRSPEGWGTLMGENIGLGAVVDFNTNPVESVLVAAQWVYHPVEPVAMILAPGFSTNDDPDTGEDSWLLRLGSRYSFEINERLSWGPEIFYDILEGGVRKGVFAVALTWHF